MKLLYVFIIVILFVLNCNCDSSSSSDDDNIQYYSLTSDFKIVPGNQVKGSIAWGYFKDELLIDGWGKLSIETVSNVSDSIAFKAAGFLEGYLTSDYIYKFSGNYLNSFFNTSDIKQVPIEVLNFVNDNWEYMETMVLNNLNSSGSDSDSDFEYWNQISNSMEQQIGIYEGYNYGNPNNPLDFIEMYIINLYGDMGDIITATTTSSNDDNGHEFKPMNRKEIEDVMVKNGHCTSLIKLLDDKSDLMSAHTSWAEYSVMIRIYKKINIPVKSTPYGSETFFSSYPGLLVSIDDFYQIRPSQLHLTETLNTILNQTLYSIIKPTSFMYWIRNLVANRLSNSGEEWVNWFIKGNSGTNNIQFVVLDYKLFTPNQQTPLQPGLLWIIEQYPGGSSSADVTNVLEKQGYWPSYNRPYFNDVFSILGYPYYVELFGNEFTYDNNPRANIFSRDQSSILTLNDMMSIIDYNEYISDPLSMGYPGNAINARYDLKGGVLPSPNSNPIYSWFYHGTHGGIDGKSINYNMMVNEYSSYARSGPTVTTDCPPFDWSNWPDISHEFMPQIYNFSWTLIKI